MTIKRCVKLITWLLTFIMVFNMAPVFALADDGDVISPVYHEGATLESSDPLGLSGKSGVLAVCVNGQYIAVINSKLNQYRRVARNVTVIDGKVICHIGQEPSIWTITKAPDGDGYYYLTNGNQYLTLTEKDGVVMTTTPTAVLASVENGKYRFSQVTGEGTKWLTLRNNKVSDGFSCDTLIKGKGETYFDLLPIGYSDKVIVAFDCNGAPNTLEDLELNVGDEITLPDYDKDYLDYELSGWKMSGNNNVYSVKEQVSIPAIEQVTFTAVWKQRTTVIFDANGGSEEAPAAIIIKDGMVSITLPDYNGKKNGNTFVGWCEVDSVYKQTTGTNHTYHEVYKPGKTYKVKSGTNTLYAIYNDKGTKTVRFGIRKDGIIQDEPNGYKVEGYVGHFAVDTSILKETHWVIDIDSTKPVNGYYVENNVTANLNWMPSAEQIAEALRNEGQIDFDPETQYIHYYVLKCIPDTTWKIDGVIRNKAKVSVTYDTNAPAGVDKTKVTQMPGSYQVKPGTDILIGADENSTTIKRPGINGYFFMGWNTKADGSGEYYHESTIVHLTENLNLYAQWIAEADNPLEIRITSDWTKGKIGYVGAKIKLTAALTGFEGKLYTLQWQYSTDQETWIDVPDAHDITYTYILDETTTTYTWRCVAQDIR